MLNFAYKNGFTSGQVLARNNLYPELSFLPHLYLCQRLTVLQESCEMAKFLQLIKLAILSCKNICKYTNT
jgi:hypothetical protein